jgi:hypothetical protein
MAIRAVRLGSEEARVKASVSELYGAHREVYPRKNLSLQTVRRVVSTWRQASKQ